MKKVPDYANPDSPRFDVKMFCAYHHNEGLKLLEERQRRELDLATSYGNGLGLIIGIWFLTVAIITVILFVL